VFPARLQRTQGLEHVGRSDRRDRLRAEVRENEIEYPFGKCDRGAPLFLAAFMGVPVLFFVVQGMLLAWLNRSRPLLIAVLAAGVVAVLFRGLLIPARHGPYGFGVIDIVVTCVILWACLALPAGLGAVLVKRRMKAAGAPKAPVAFRK
jgi:hypothetical protein